ncbi:MAG: c-type cytochrome biogenesis protein CcmI [Rubrivivax sp.]|nr:c-type cytochrome biogenesis protein CcmI [Rubrivivax sp.]
MNDDIATLRSKLQQLKSLHDSGALGAPAYESGKARLERELLDRVLADPGSAAPAASTAGAPAARPSVRLVVLLGLAVAVVAVAGYSWTGSPSLITGPVAAPTAEGGGASPHDMSGEQFAAAVEKLALKLKDEPDNLEGWAMLARSYTRMGKFADALPAFEKAASLPGADAGLLADYADTMAVSNNRSLEGRPMQLVERALKLEPDNLKALALAGTAAFNRKDYALAVRHWERVAQKAPADEAFQQQVQASIDEARKLAGMPPAANLDLGAAKAQPATPPPAAAAAASGAVRGTVRLSPTLAKQAAPADIVFIYARPAEGSRMPLAIQRLQVKDLPAEFSLDDSMAMSPGARLSLFPKVIVSARISKNGQAVPAAGDLVGQSAAVSPDTQGLQIDINEVLKN